MSDNNKPAPKKGRASQDKISEFLNLPDEPVDIIPVTKTNSPVEVALNTQNTDDDDVNDLSYVKDIQRDLLAKGMDMIDEVMFVAKTTNDLDAHDVVIKYIKELSKANQGLLDLNRRHYSNQEAKARTKKINKDILNQITSSSKDDDETIDEDRYTIRTTSSDMLKMVRELEAAEEKKKKKK